MGELVQIDGSPHAWLEARGPKCTLIAFIDDATGRLQYARFEPAETSRAYLRGLRAYVSQYGRPVAFYSDRHSIFTKHDPEDPTPTQFERAVRKTLQRQGLDGTLTERAKNYLADKGYDPVFGARPLKRVMQKELINEIATHILEGELQKGDVVKIDAADGRLVLEA